MKRIAFAGIVALSALAQPATALPPDKRAHAITGTAIYGAARAAGYTPRQSVAATAIVGVGYEAFQHVTKSGHVEAMDAVATIVPALLLAGAEWAISQRRTSPRNQPYIPTPVARESVIGWNPRGNR